MNIVIVIFGVIGFFICLFIMYRTDHGIPGIQKYDSEFRLLDMRFRYTGKDLYNTFERILEEGRKAYKNYLLLDFCFIACFLIVMIAISQKVVTDRYSGLIYILIGLAITRALFDVIENTILIILLNMYSKQNIVVANICSWATTFKFLALYLWLVGIGLNLLFL